MTFLAHEHALVATAGVSPRVMMADAFALSHGPVAMSARAVLLAAHRVLCELVSIWIADLERGLWLPNPDGGWADNQPMCYGFRDDVKARGIC